MWANRDWVGRYFPAGLPTGGELEAYAKWCNAVEGNTTFYALPKRTAVERWATQVPGDFRFLLKLPRTITHDRRLRNAEAELAEALDRFEPLGDVMGPVSIQLPGSFGPEDVAVLDRFLARLPQDFSWGVEVRHPDFSNGDHQERTINDLLFGHGVNRIIIDTRAFFAGPSLTPAEQEATHRKPRLPVRAVATADQPVVRFVGQTDAAPNPGFWARWVTTVAGWIDQGKRPIFFAHTPDNAVSPALCRQFHDQVAEVVDGLTPLPDPHAPAPGDQLEIF